MKKKRTKAFTLVELMAVIIILGVVALIVYPVIDNSIKSSREKSLERTIENIEEAAYNYSVEYELEKPDIDNQKAIRLDRLQSAGFLEKEIINPVTEEKMQGCIWYYWDNNQYYFEYDQECVLEEPTLVITYDKGLITNGWAKANMLVNIVSTGDSIKYCIDNNECEPNIEEKMPTYSVGVSKEGTNYICAIAINPLGESNRVCESIKMDKTLPIISGISDITVMRNDPVDLETGITYEDALSGIEGELIIEPSTVDTSTVGTKQVTYRVKDKAGNIREVVRNIIVDANAPTVTFTLTSGTINSNGWAKSDFYVRATITDNSGTGIKTAASCTTNTTGECTPVGTFTGNIKDNYITTEGSNRICIQVTDNNNKTTKICSNTYNLDKTKPTLAYSFQSGGSSYTSNSWAKDDITSTLTPQDATSGVLSIQYQNNCSGSWYDASNILNVTKSTEGTERKCYKVTDKAGNESDLVDLTLKLDKTKPTLTYKLTSNDSNYNQNTWTRYDIVRQLIPDDTTSGVSKVQYSSGCTGTWVDEGNVDEWTMTSTGINDTCYKVIDNAGNESLSLHLILKIDKVAPILTYTMTTSDGDYTSGDWSNKNVTRKFTSTDADSGSYKIQYQTNCAGTWYDETNASGWTMTSEGINYACFKAIDNVGNESSPISITIKIDKTAPVITSGGKCTPNPGTNVCVKYVVNDNLADNLTVTRSHCAVPKVASQTNAVNYCVSGYSAKERLEYYVNNGSLKSPDNKTITRRNLSEPYSEELHTSFASDYSIQYAMRACDNAGNCSGIKTFTYDGSNGTFK